MMEENTIFTPPSQNPPAGGQPDVTAPVASPPGSPPPSSQPTVSPASPAQPPGIPPPPPGGSPFGTLIKIILGVLLLLVLGFVLFYFISSRFSGNLNGKVTLTYWGLWEDKATMQSLIDDFEKQHPNITINYEKQDGKQYKDRLLTRTKNGTGPDIFRFHNSWVPELTDTLAPLPTSVIDKDTFAKTFYPVIQQDLLYNGAIYGIPLSIDTLELFTNTTLLQSAGLSAPKTWEDFNHVASTLTVKDPAQNNKITTAGAALGTYDNITHAPDIISMLLVQNGANLKQLGATKQNASDALNFYTSFTTDPNNVWDATLDPSILAFAKGNLAMYFGYSWDIFTIKGLNPNLTFDISPVPKLPGESSGKTIASYWVEGVSVKSKYQKEAFLFMQYLTQKSTEQKFFTESAKTRLFGEPYARIDLADTLKGNAVVYPFVAGANNAASSYFAADTYDTGLNGEANQYLAAAINSIVSNVSSQTAVDTLVNAVAQVLSRYGIQ